jgi:tRNA pseudouridine38-40 synthase
MSRSDVESKAGKHRGPAPGFKRLRLTVAYCGTPWRGWQSLDGGDTITDKLNAAVAKATGIVVSVQGSGRTDAGVHALAQVAHFDVPESVRMSAEAWADAINACMPLSIRVVKVEDAHPSFHARFDATGKTYRYRIWRPRLMSPFEADRAWHVYGPLDIESLRDAPKSSSARTTSSAFPPIVVTCRKRSAASARKRPRAPSHRAEVREVGDVIELEFEGDGFLYKMVRLIVGSLMHIARRRATKEWFAELLETAEGLQSNQCAPACGLYLVRVNYPA